MGDSAWGGAFNPRRMLETALSETDFESVSHEQMRSMIEAADPETTSKLGGKLKKAAVKIEEIGTELRTRMTAVAWEGEGGEAFREWGAKVADETLRLSEFSRTSGAWLTEAATVLAEVKGAMPPPSSSSRALLDAFFERNPGGRLMLSEATAAQSKDSGGNSVLMGPTPKQALAAQTRLNEDHAEAVRLMTKLAGSYRWSSMNMSAAERPKFPPPPAAVMPERENIRGSRRYYSGDEETTAPGTAERSAATVPASAFDVGGGRNSRASLPAVEAPGIAPDRAVGVNIAGVVDSPPAPAGPALNAGQPAGGPAPPHGDATPHPGTASAPFTRSGPGSSGPAGRPTPFTSRLVGPAQAVAGGTPRRPLPGPVDQGIHGGRPAPPSGGRPAGAIPRGTVVGGDQARGYGRPMGPVGGVGPGGGQPGVAAGRRLAAESGGVVGGRAPRPGTAMGHRLTPGGTGPVRGQAAAGGTADGRGAAPAQPGGGNSGRDRKAKRPSNPGEDDTTWTQGSRRVVPPVVD